MKSPRELERQRNAVVAFYNAYQHYLDSVLGDNGASDAERFRQRGEVIARMPGAQRGLNEAGVAVAFTPPPMFAGRIPVMTGLANTAFLHEQPGWRMEEMAGIKPTYVEVMEILRLATHELEERAKEATRQRRNPLFWIDRVLRALLGLPAYLLSLIFRVPVSRIEESPFGVVLRVLSVAIQALGVYVAGRAAKVW